MANTYWVRATGDASVRNDANDGLLYTTAWATIKHATDILQSAGTKGDIVNIVNDGTHALETAALINNVALLGTSFSDPGFTLRGTTSSGTPALASCAATGGGARLVDIRNSVRYIIIRGLTLDYTACAGGTDVVRMTGNTSGPALVEACHVKGYNDNAIGIDQRAVLNNITTGTPDYGIVRYCYIENCPDALDAALGFTTKKVDWNHTVFSFRGDWSNGFIGTLQCGNTPVSASNVVGFTQNTIYVDENGSSSIAGIFDWGPAAGNFGAVDIHSNYGWIETNGTVPQVFSGAPGSTATFTGTIGFNTIRFGPSVIAADNPGGLYEAPYDAGTDPKASDSVAYTTASSAIFNAVGSAWTWTDVNGTGYDIPLPRDLRPTINLTSSSTGGVPGALPAVPVADETDLAIDIGASTTTPAALEPFAVTVTITNTILAATSVVAQVTIPSGLSLLSATPDTGTYNDISGVWTVGTVGIGDTALLALVVRPYMDQGGNSIPFPVSITSFATPSLDTNLANNTDSITIVVDTIKKPPGEPPPPSATNEKKLPPQLSTDEKVLSTFGLTASVTLPLLSDAGPNTFVSFGAGASQTARLSDSSDATGIRRVNFPGQSRFNLDTSTIPVGASVTQVTFVIRETNTILSDFVASIMNVVVNGLVFAFVLNNIVDTDFGPTDREYPIFTNEIVDPADVPTIQVEVDTGVWFAGNRWTILELEIRLDYVSGGIEKTITETVGTEKAVTSTPGTKKVLLT